MDQHVCPLAVLCILSFPISRPSPISVYLQHEDIEDWDVLLGSCLMDVAETGPKLGDGQFGDESY